MPATSVSFDELDVTADGVGTPTTFGAVFSGSSISIRHNQADPLFYRHGWNSWSPTGWRRLSEEPLRIYDNPDRLRTADDIASDTPGVHSGSGVGALQLDDGRILLLGGLGLNVPRVTATTAHLHGTADDASGDWYAGVGPELDVFAEYAALLRQRYGHADRSVGNVWSSWYSYFEDITEQNLQEAISDLQPYAFDTIQVDDGWERAVGDWTANDKFPSGLPYLVDTITATGLAAGLWVAPFIASLDSDIAKAHPEWMIQDGAGAPLIAGHNWAAPYWALDTTQSAVQEHLRAVFTELTQAGFNYFKLDFLYAAALSGRRSEAVPREVAYREAVQLIRDTVGPDVYLLGSGVPMIPSIGVFDGVRVGPDTAPYWDNIERKRDQSGAAAYNALATSASRLWMQPLYQLDPDVAFFRSRNSLLDDETRHILQDLAYVTGFRSTSDPVAWLDADERSALQAFLTRTDPYTQLDRYRYRIGTRERDFAPWIDPQGRVSDRLVVK